MIGRLIDLIIPQNSLIKSLVVMFIVFFTTSGLFWDVSEAFTYFEGNRLKDLIGTYWTLVYIGGPFSLAIILGLITWFIETRKPYSHLRRILNFKNNHVLVVFPYDEYSTENQSLLPKVATESLMAAKNVDQMLNVIGCNYSMRDSDNIHEHDKKQNLILLGGPKHNGLTKEALSMLNPVDSDGKPIDVYRFECSSQDDMWKIVTTVNEDDYKSSTYDQQKLYTQKNTPQQEQEYTDRAIITKMNNPWSKDAPPSKIIIIAGIRGVGLWGAAEYLRKKPDELLKKFSGRKDCNFSALIRIKYRNLDIIERDCQHLSEF